MSRREICRPCLSTSHLLEAFDLALHLQSLSQVFAPKMEPYEIPSVKIAQANTKYEKGEFHQQYAGSRIE
jgi:hypothetical protein